MNGNDHFRAHTRRGFLQGIGTTTIGVGISAERIDGSDETPTSDVAQSVSDHTWSMFKNDAANTGHHPTATGPTGDVEQDRRFEADATSVSSPAVVDDTAYVGTDEGAVYSLDTATGTVRDGWPFETDDQVLSIPTVVDGTVYVGSSDQHVYAIGADSGNEEWSFETVGEVEGRIKGSPTVVDDTVYVGSSDANAYALDAETGTLRDGWPVSVANQRGSTPAVAGGIVYLTGVYEGRPAIYAVDADTGAGKWDYSLPTRDASIPGPTSPAVAGGSVYVGSMNKSLYALDAATGDRQWEFRRREPIQSSPVVADGTVYAGFDNWYLYAVDATSGEEVWRHQLNDAPVRTAPAVVDGTLYVSTVDHTVYAFDPETPEERWRVDLDVPETGVKTPTVIDGTVYVGTYDGALYALDGEGGGRSTGNEPPEAVFEIETAVPTAGQEVTFDASESIDPDGTITAYKWDFDDDDEFEKEGEQVTYTFHEPREHRVYLRVTDSDGAMDTESRMVRVGEASSGLEFDQVRLVQRVDDEYNPHDLNISLPTVAGQTASVLFGFAEDYDIDSQLDELDSVSIKISHDAAGEAITLPPIEINQSWLGTLMDKGPIDILSNADWSEVFPNGYPSFTPTTDLTQITVSIDPPVDGVSRTEETLYRGEHFTIEEPRTLNLGFIPVRDFSHGSVYGPSGSERPWTHLLKYEQTVRDAIQYIQRTFPASQINAYRHDVAIRGEPIAGAFPVDMKEAQRTLDSIQSDHGPLTAETDVEGTLFTTKDREITENPGDVEIEDFDEVVMVAPADYFDFHGQSGGGVHLGDEQVHQKTASAVLEWDADIVDGNPRTAGSLTAHEIAHHFVGPIYQGRFDSIAKDDSDPRHCDHLLNWIAIIPREKEITVEERPSFMSYNFEKEVWADEVVMKELINSEFDPYRKETSQLGRIPALSVQGIIIAQGTKTFEGIRDIYGSAEEFFDVATDTFGVAKTKLSRGIEGTISEVGEIQQEILDFDENVIGSFSLPDKATGTFAQPENPVTKLQTIPFAIPFLADGYEIQITYDGTQARINPHVTTLQNAVRALPSTAFKVPSETSRRAIFDQMDTVTEALEDRTLEDATESIDQFRETVDQRLTNEYETAANQPTKTELLETVDHLDDRIETLQFHHGEGGLPSYPDWLPWAGGAGAVGLGAGAYRYLQGRETAEHSGEGDDE